MSQKEILIKTEEYIKTQFSGEGTGHDWWHIHRVKNLALNIAKKEKADLFIVELASLLHDLGDHKFHKGIDKSAELSRKWLSELGVEEEIIKQICEIVSGVSYKGAGVETKMQSIEGKIVQDSDRLDAIGAIGIARTFAYGGSKGNEFYNPDIKPVLHNSFKDYKKSTAPVINHFYEKLLLLKDRLNTETAKHIALERHKFMESYLERFYNEWDGKK